MSNKPQAMASVGPMRNFATNSKKIANELIESNDQLMEFNTSLAEYYKQLTDTWNESQKKVAMKSPKIPKDPEQFEAYKRTWIEIFDNDFTQLFDSKEFGENYGKLVSKELELTKHWNNIMKKGLMSLEDTKQDEMMFMELALRVRMRHEFDKEFGAVQFSLSYRDNVVIISFSIGQR